MNAKKAVVIVSLVSFGVGFSFGAVAEFPPRATVAPPLESVAPPAPPAPPSFQEKCERMGGIAVKRWTSDWFNGGRATDDCVFPPKS